MGFGWEPAHKTGSCMVQIRLESLFSVQCPKPTIGMDKGRKIETISIATILQRVVRLGASGRERDCAYDGPRTPMTVEHLETFLTRAAKEKSTIMTENSRECVKYRC